MLPAPLLLLSFLLSQLSFLVLVAVAETSGWRDIGDDSAQVPHHPLTPTAVGVSRLRTVHVGGVEGKTGGIEPRTFTVQNYQATGCRTQSQDASGFSVLSGLTPVSCVTIT